MRRAAQSLVRLCHCLRLQVGTGGEAEEKLFVGKYIFEHRTVERRILRRTTQALRTQARNIKESAEPLRVGREKA
jgi:hypothetical protein